MFYKVVSHVSGAEVGNSWPNYRVGLTAQFVTQREIPAPQIHSPNILDEEP